MEQCCCQKRAKAAHQIRLCYHSRFQSLYQQNRLQVRAQAMGLECAKPIEQQISRSHDSRQKTFQAQMRKIKEITSFQIKINNLRLLNFSKSFHNIKIQLSDAFSFVIPFIDLHFHDNVLISSQTYLTEFKTSIQSLSDKYVQFFLEEKGGRTTEILRIKVHQLFRGPVKHDHLLRELKARLLFDFHIDQYITSHLSLENCQIQWKEHSNQKDYAYFLSLIFPNSGPPVQTCKVFEKHEKIKELCLDNIRMRNSQLRDAGIKIKVVDQATQVNVLQYFLPISKLQQQNGFKTIIKSNAAYELRQFQIRKDVCLEGSTHGVLQLHLTHLKSKLYAEQMECVILSQNGIVMHTLTESPTKSPQTTKNLDLTTLANYLNQLQQLIDNGISEYAFYTLLEEILIEIQDKNIAITDQLFQAQQLLLTFLLLLTDLLSPQRVMQNDYIWEIINRLCKEPILKLKYFCSIKNPNEKLIFAKKFYKFIISAVKKIIKLTESVLNFKELVGIHKFMAYAFFRLPWCQDEVVKVLQKKDDPVISEEKLAEIGASYALKSPSKNYFFDWEGSVLRLIKREESYMILINELNQLKNSNNKWAKLLFDREYEQLFYRIYSELWDEAETILENNGKILWQYFPKYGELLSIFFGEISNSKIMDFSPEMTKCNMKLIKNEKLLTSFMMLIFPKTHLFETYCVIKCLNLIECYFSVILNDHKMLPYNFHYNYFFTAIKCILESEHSYLLQKTLSIIYKFYFIFGREFKEDLNKFILHKVFYKLFLHWSQDVRSIFYMLLLFKIYHQQQQFHSSENPEQTIKKQKNSSQLMQVKLQYEHTISSLIRRQQYNKANGQVKGCSSTKNELFEKMKAKLNKRRKESSQSAQISTNQELSEGCALRKCSFIEATPFFGNRKWSLAEESSEYEELDCTEEQLKYLSRSLREFQQAKTETKPDEKVEMRSKMFQFNADQ